MWLMNFIPQGLVHLVTMCVLFGGVALYIFGILLNFWPPAKPYKEIVRILSTVLIILGVFLYGGYDQMYVTQQQVAAMQAKVDEAEHKSQTANTKIITKIRTRTKVIHDYKVVYKNQIKEVAVKIDSECKVDPVAIKILNNAAKEPPEKSK